MEVREIKFNGLDFILTSPQSEDSPIATKEQFKTGSCSYAHLYGESERVMQFGNQIGTIDDIEFGEMVELEVDPIVALIGFLGSSWPF